MWVEIEDLDLPFHQAKATLTTFWKVFTENFKNPYVSLIERIQVAIGSIMDDMSLTPEEVFDVEMSWEEIRKGQAKKFTNVDELLEELKR